MKRLRLPAMPALPGQPAAFKPLMQQIRPRWRQVRRQFDARLLNERRLLIIAALALVWFVSDSLLITPALSQIKAANNRERTASTATQTMQSELNRKRSELANQMLAAQREQEALRQRLEQGKEDLARQQSMLAPAREMRALLEGLLAQNGQLRVKGMRTLVPKEVNFAPAAGREGGQPPQLYNHGLEISVSGSYIELLQWLRSVETMPRRLLWDSLTLNADEHARLTLTLVVHTFSPDRDALEIAP
ncbi:MAG: hypothetical protein IIA02_02970 [Proteobacteria bacterium]|uniref:hypothetical protein n=1 Tax=Aquabacterium sp. TaxID=1872578 RepID=UPI0035C705B2|nr:hypothetical protein [Pseudomonadota bacterium]